MRWSLFLFPFYLDNYTDRLNKHGITLYVHCSEDGQEVYSLSAKNSAGQLIKGVDNEAPLKAALAMLERHPSGN